MSKLTEVWGGSKAQIADKVRIYSDKTNKIPSFVMLTLLHEAMKEIDELECGVSMDILGSFHEWVNRRMDEARLDWRRHGTPLAALAGRYGVSARTLERAFKRMDERGMTC